MNRNQHKVLVDIYRSQLVKHKYHNFEKLEILFQEWLETLTIILEEEDIDRIEISNPEKNFFKKNKLASINRRQSCVITAMFKNILSSINIFKVPSILFGPGGYINNKWWSRFISDLTLKFLSKKKKINKTFYNSFMEESRKNLPDDTILKIIPVRFFYEEYVQIIKKGHIKFICSPTILTNSNWFNILLIPKRVDIVGITHGGNYDEYQINHFQSFEEAISDSYYGWGLNKFKNIPQNRFKKEKKEVVEYKAKFGWIERLPPTALEIRKIPSIKSIYNESEEILEYMVNRNSNIEIFNHPRNQKQYLTLRSIKSDQEVTYILGNPGNTVLYEFLYKKIPFIVIFKRSWLKYLTPEMNNWVSFLGNSRILYFFDDKEILEKELTKIEANLFPPINFEKLIKFLENDCNTLSF